jgi:predicted MPP superfamily phosphohydrolase
VLARLLAPLGVSIVAVLGNHDLRATRQRCGRALRSARVIVLDLGHHVIEIADLRVGIASTTGACRVSPTPSRLSVRRSSRA